MFRARLFRTSADASEEFEDLNEAIARAAGLLHDQPDGEEVIIYCPSELRMLAIVMRDAGCTRTIRLA